MKSDRRITMNDLNREVLQHNKLPDLVLDKLMEWIMSGKLSMGDKLNTEELASQLGVSRMPIREALSNLEKKGLAESIPYAGTRLITLTKEDVRQIYIARTALEPVAARYACEKIRYRIWKRFKKNIRGSCRRIQLMRLMYTSRTDCIISQFTKRVS